MQCIPAERAVPHLATVDLPAGGQLPAPLPAGPAGAGARPHYHEPVLALVRHHRLETEYQVKYIASNNIKVTAVCTTPDSCEDCLPVGRVAGDVAVDRDTGGELGLGPGAVRLQQAGQCRAVSRLVYLADSAGPAHQPEPGLAVVVYLTPTENIMKKD